MSNVDATSHEDKIREQFSRLAPQYAVAHGATHVDATSRLLAATRVTERDVVLDVACGAGQVALAFAAVAGQVTGLDVTPAMIERARALQAEAKVENVRWCVGDVYNLPFEDGEFSIVTCRYAFHHMLNPAAAVAEMVRVCAPDGRVALVGVYTTVEKGETFNSMERLRDPSHVRALALEEIIGLATATYLENVQCDFYPYEGELENLLKGSSPAPGNEEKVRDIITRDVDRNELGISARRDGTEIRVSYPIAIVTAWRA
jgi:ubiquinone/menaquinone biosynthesis C-methylase UbiE